MVEYYLLRKEIRSVSSLVSQSGSLTCSFPARRYMEGWCRGGGLLSRVLLSILSFLPNPLRVTRIRSTSRFDATMMENMPLLITSMRSCTRNQNCKAKEKNRISPPPFPMYHSPPSPQHLSPPALRHRMSTRPANDLLVRFRLDRIYYFGDEDVHQSWYITLCFFDRSSEFQDRIARLDVR